MGEERLVTEVPSSLKQLARLVVRGFYTIEDALIVDMLVRNPCEYVCQRMFSLKVLLGDYEIPGIYPPFQTTILFVFLSSG
jgi:hypothetical protein